MQANAFASQWVAAKCERAYRDRHGEQSGEDHESFSHDVKVEREAYGLKVPIDTERCSLRCVCILKLQRVHDDREQR